MAVLCSIKLCWFSKITDVTITNPTDTSWQPTDVHFELQHLCAFNMIKLKLFSKHMYISSEAK